MMIPPRCHALWCAVLLLGTAARAGASWSSTYPTSSDSGVGIEITSPIDHPPPGGYLPCWVTIRNHSGAARTWNIRAAERIFMGNGGSQTSSSQSLRVESGETARLAVLLPLVPLPHGVAYYRPHSIQIDGYGAESSSASLPPMNYNGKLPTAFIGMGNTLAVPLWEPIKKELADRARHGMDLNGSPVDVGLLHPDWRGLSGFDCLWLTEAEYAGLDAPRQLAIRQWIDQGGTFYLCSQTLDPTLRAGLGLPETGGEAHPGLGLVRLIPWDGKSFSQDAAIAIIDGFKPLHEDTAANDATGWKMAKAVGTIPLNAPFLIVFIIAFAVFVGPVNLFWWADATRRHRLFWTTPLVSVTASLLLILVIAFQDGLGGSGERVMATLLFPDQKTAVVVQEQVSRTGVLLSRRFSVAEDLVLSPLKVARDSGRSYNQSGRNYGGDWFASRSVQAQRAEAIVPSRAAISLLNAGAARGGAPPVVVSSIPAALRAICYTDPAGHCWRGDGLRTGEQITLRPDTSLPAPELPGGSDFLNEIGQRVGIRPGYFYALADNGPFIETLPAIRWKKQQAAFFGPVTVAP